MPVLADRECDSRRLEDDQVQEQDSHEEQGPCAVDRDSSADRAACGVHKDIAGILADTVACGHRMELEVGPEDTLGRSRAVACADQSLAFPGGRL